MRLTMLAVQISFCSGMAAISKTSSAFLLMRPMGHRPNHKIFLRMLNGVLLAANLAVVIVASAQCTGGLQYSERKTLL